MLLDVFLQSTCVGLTNISAPENSSSTWGTSLCQHNLERSTIEPRKNLNRKAAPQNPRLGFDTTLAAPSRSSTGKNSDEGQAWRQDNLAHGDMFSSVMESSGGDSFSTLGGASVVESGVVESGTSGESGEFAQSSSTAPHTAEELG